MVKIIDFGLAKAAHSLGQEISVTHTGLSMLVQAAVFGTLDYAPPEQQGKIQYGPPGPKSDMYAFGKTMYRLLTGESTSTFIPKNLPDAPELFELLCDCVCDDPAKRVSLEDFIRRLKELRFSKREWWKQLDDNWKKVFKEAIGIDAEPNNSDLEKIVDLSGLDCSNSQISNLEPLHYLLYMQELDCRDNQKISDLGPLQALTNLRKLDCGYNQKISDLKPLRVLPMLHEISCNHNQITSLEPLTGLVKLLNLHCGGNPISESEREEFNLN